MKRVIIFLLALGMLTMNIIEIQSQICNTDYWPFTGVENGVFRSSRNGHDLPASGSIRLLFIFAEFDYYNGGDPVQQGGLANWPEHSLPTWAYDLADPISPSGLSSKAVTRYFQQASSNNLTVLGDVLLAPTNNGVFIIPWGTGSAASFHYPQVISAINSSLSGLNTANAMNDISYFDYWTPTSRGEPKISPSTENPRRYDCVVIFYRNSAYGNNGTALPYNLDLSLLGYKINRLINIGTYNEIPDHLVIHEYAHFLLGGNDFHTAGGGTWSSGDYWIPDQGGWAMLSLAGASLRTWSAWDRHRMGWKEQGSSFYISARDQANTQEVNGDLDATISSDAGIFLLRDFATTGDAIRIKLPFTDAQTEFNEYIWIENHTTESNNQCPFDKFKYETGNSCIAPAISGMYAYLQIGRDVVESYSQNEVFGGYANYLRPLPASGFQDREIEAILTQNDCINNEDYKAFLLMGDNPLSGGSDQEMYVYDKDANSVISASDENINFIEKIGSTYYKNLFMNGHSRHAFSQYGNFKIGIGTNPSSACRMNMVGYNSPTANAKNIRNVYLNGVSIEILDQLSSGDLIVEVKFDDVLVDRDVRWCADDIVLNPIETPSGYSLILQSGKKITLDQGLTATRMNNPQTFQGQQMFVDPTTFVIKPEARVKLEENAAFELKNGSTMDFQEHTECYLQNNAIIEVQAGNTFKLDDCALLKIEGNGQLIVRSGASLCISPYAKLDLENSIQNLVLEQGIIIPAGYANPTDFIQNSVQDLVVTTDLVWSGKVYSIYGSITVEAGASFTISSSSLEFSDPNSKIVVKPYGKLVLDGSVLSGACNKMWQGIQVWGDPTKPQNDRYANGMLKYQGEVLVLGTDISNADIAISAIKKDNYGNFDWSKCGGVIRASGANFINNRGGIWIGGYHPPMIGGNGPMPYNKSRIQNCHFEINNGFPEPMNFHWHIGLCGGRGIVIQGNNFYNDASGISANKRGSGIVSYNFPVDIGSICANSSQPCNELDNNNFSGLFYGIEVYDSQHNLGVHKIRNCDITKCTRGIYLGNTHSAMVLENTIDIPADVSYEPYGLYIDGGNGFTVEGNEFETADGSTYARGLIVHNTGGNDNEIYRNDFQNLLAGVQAQEVNKDNNLHGLKFFCNTHDNRYYDFWVGDKFNSSNSPIGIAEAQVYDIGAGILPTGNVFTSGTRFGDLNFSNGQAEWLTYHYYDGSSVENPGIYHSGINPLPKYDENTCPAKATGGGGASLGQLYASRAAAKVALNSSTLILNIWKDGGNVELGEEVEAALPWEAYETFNDLMGTSPFLSDEALIAAIENPVFSSLMIKLLMIANPHSTRSEPVMEALYQRNPPLPESYIQEITGELGTVSQLELLEADMATDRHLYHKLGEQIKRTYRSDTTNVWAKDSLLSFMGRDDQLTARYELASAQMEFGFPEAANLTLEDIPTAYELSETEAADHQKFTTLLGIKETMMESSVPIGCLSQAQTDNLMDYVEANRPLITAAAVAMLKQNDPDFVFNEIILQPDINSVPKQALASLKSKKESSLKLYPNPAYDYITVSCKLDQYVQSSYKLQLYNALGQLLYERALSVDNTEQMIPLRDYPAGNYHFILVGDGQHLANEKFTIIR